MQHNTDLQNKIFKIILIIGAILSIISIIGNIMGGFPYQTNIKWIFIGALSLIIYGFEKSSHKKKYFRLLYFLSIILVFIPFGWIDSGGSNNNTIAYVFLVMICITYLFEKKTRIMLITLLILTFITLFCLEHFYPQIINVYNVRSQFLDRLMQIPLTLIGGYLLLKQFSDTYIHEKEKLDIYSKELQAANKKLEFMANRDGLTEVYNRRAFDFKLEEIISAGKHFDKDIYVILFDVDYFKSINDTYGHSMGDKVIFQLTDSAKDIMPETSFISRWGGDEFAIIFYGNKEEMKKCMDEFNKKINDIKIDGNDVITISTGVTKIAENDNVSKVFKRVDEALYISKIKGKNQYTIM